MRGPCHDYLGMHIDFSDRGAVAFDMIRYIKGAFTAFPKKIMGVSSTPAADHLFTVCPPHKSKMLPEEQARVYYCMTAQLLFLSRVCCDIQTTVAYLTTRVKQPNEDDWGKLNHVLKYFNFTRLLHLTLFAESLTNNHWYVDASHQTHDNCKGHTGSLLTFGKGATTSSSNKQKILPKSSSRSKIIALYDKSSDILWIHQYLDIRNSTMSLTTLVLC